MDFVEVGFKDDKEIKCKPSTFAVFDLFQSVVAGEEKANSCHNATFLVSIYICPDGLPELLQVRSDLKKEGAHCFLVVFLLARIDTAACIRRIGLLNQIVVFSDCCSTLLVFPDTTFPGHHLFHNTVDLGYLLLDNLLHEVHRWEVLFDLIHGDLHVMQLHLGQLPVVCSSMDNVSSGDYALIIHLLCQMLFLPEVLEFFFVKVFAV